MADATGTQLLLPLVEQPKRGMTFAEALAAKPPQRGMNLWNYDTSVKSWVYFITDGRAIKIGVAGCVESRMSELQVSHHTKLTLLARVPGDQKLEAKLHEKWRYLNIRGEWFKDHPEIRFFVRHGRHKSQRRS